ncbi:MAG: hypothetical protein J6Z47_05780 [Bacteroidales bacterium]|nr:hypothetical protein [Bacteroidales bacterium]
MSKKTLVIMIVAALVLLGGIAAGISYLYKSDSPGSGTAAGAGQFIENHSLVTAIPSDAALVLCVKDFGKACEMLSDTTAVFRELTSGKFDRLVSEDYPALKRNQAIISVHYTKDMPPLLVIEAAKAIADTLPDCTRLLATADSAGLFCKTAGSLILISPSETIVNSSLRHISEGHSVLESSGFSELSSNVSGDNIIFASNAYTDNILDAYFAKRLRKCAPFIKEISDWMAFSIGKYSGEGVSAHGELLYGSDPAYFLNVLRHAGTGPVTVTEAVPSRTEFIIDIPVGNIAAYIKAYRNYLDAKTRLDKYESTLSKQKKEHGFSAEDWAKSLDIKEAALADIHFDNKLRHVILIKPGAKHTESATRDFAATAGYLKTLFGGIFTGEGETAATSVKGWIVAGESDVIRYYAENLGETLADRLAANVTKDRVPQKECGFWAYHSLSEDPTLIDASFSPSMAKGIRRITSGVTYAPVTLYAVAQGDKMGLEFQLDRMLLKKGSTPGTSRDTAVIVPSGPFKVTNSGTGKTNKFYQNSHLSLCLQDENGKDLWGIPFKYPIRGFVQEADYFNNGKIQFLFAADSKLYLIDRLGRFVSGFPVELGKEVAAGPKLYDFTGAKGYTAMVLFKDNTVGYVDLHGRTVASWKGIDAPDTIKEVPELLESGGKRYWLVRTASCTLVYPFEGGESLVKAEGDKRIRPDSKITVNEKGSLTGQCYDGKERTFKLGQ